MSFYKEKAKAYRKIDQMLSDGKPQEVIIFRVATEFGFSEKIVKERIKMIRLMQEAKK